MKAAFGVLYFLFGLVCFLSNNTLAHEGRPVFIQVKTLSSTDTDKGQQGYSLQWKVPPVFSPGSEPAISLYGNKCTSLPFKVTPGLSGNIRYFCTFSTSHPSVKIDYPDVNPALSSLLVFQDEQGRSSHIFSGPETFLVKIPESASVYTIAKQYVVGGVNHILGGWDHLLFVLCLLILAGSTRRILITITGFTLAHTVTLALTALNVISLPFLLVEALIALSIVVLAAEILKGKRKDKQKSLTWRYPVLVASLFGLLHGFGFASILGNLGLPQNMKVTALLFFNLGIELGQLAFIAVALFLTTIAKNFAMVRRQQDNLVHFIIYLCGITASYWMVQRLISI